MKIDTTRIFGSPIQQFEDFLELIWNRATPFILGVIGVRYNEYFNTHIWATIVFTIILLINVTFHLTVRFNTNEPIFDLSAKKHKVVGRNGK